MYIEQGARKPLRQCVGPWEPEETPSFRAWPPSFVTRYLSFDILFPHGRTITSCTFKAPCNTRGALITVLPEVLLIISHIPPSLKGHGSSDRRISIQVVDKKLFISGFVITHPRPLCLKKARFYSVIAFCLNHPYPDRLVGWGRARTTYSFLLNNTMKSSDFRPYVTFFDPKKCNIENSPCFIQPYNAHFTPKYVRNSHSVGFLDLSLMK